MSLPRTFVLRLRLDVGSATRDEVEVFVGDRLHVYDHRLRQRGLTWELTLTVPARDLWHAVLLGMAAVTTLGYIVQEIDGRPADPRAGRHEPVAR